MLLGNRRKQNEEQNWSLVLSPLRNEIDKKKVAAKISEVFSLSLEESFDLTANTPIILLDNLSRKVAIQVKEFFSTTGADMVLTNDIFYKRKCYRTVWPEPPNLSFLTKQSFADSKDESIVTAGPERLKADDAITALRSAETPHVIASERISKGQSDKQQELVDELERWRRECQMRRIEVEKLHKDLAELKQNSDLDPSEVELREKELQEKNQMIDDLRRSVADSESRYRSLREEYKQARSIFEDKLLRASQTYSGSSDKLNMLEDRVKGLSEKNRDLEFQLAKAKQELAQVEDQDSQKAEQKEQRMREAIQSFENEKRLNFEMRNELESLRQSALDQTAKIQELETGLKQDREARDLARLKLEDAEKRREDAEIELAQLRTQSASLIALKTEYEKFRDNADNDKNQLMAELERLSEECRVLSVTNDKQQAELSSKRENIEALSQKCLELEQVLEQKANATQELERQFLNLEKAFQELRSRSSRQEKVLNERQIMLEEKLKETELLQKEKSILNQNLFDAQQMIEVQKSESQREKESLNEVLGIKEQENAQLKAQVLHLEKLTNGLKSEFADFENLLSAREKQLEAREREAESLRRQMKELKAQLDQKDLVHRRTQLNAAMVEKEDMLKQLVAEQKRIELEIREREDIMRQVLSKQEAVEKELMDVKQTQRHIQEQSKKEARNLGSSSKNEEVVQMREPTLSKDTLQHD